MSAAAMTSCGPLHPRVRYAIIGVAMWEKNFEKHPTRPIYLLKASGYNIDDKASLTIYPGYGDPDEVAEICAAFGVACEAM